MTKKIEHALFIAFMTRVMQTHSCVFFSSFSCTNKSIQRLNLILFELKLCHLLWIEGSTRNHHYLRTLIIVYVNTLLLLFTKKLSLLI
jgi:hypothetical protein